MRPVFEDVERSGLHLRRVRSWAGAGLVHGFSHRLGGASRPPFASLNLALHVADDESAVLANREKLWRALDWDPDRVVAGRQVHEAEVAVAEEADAGRGARGVEDALDGVDAIVTAVPGLLLTAFFADCTPILLYDGVKPAVGVAHAGWRGTALDVAGAAVAAMGSAFGSRPENMEAAIGPAIGPCCYEVGPEVAERIELVSGGPGTATRRGPIVSAAGGRWTVDLAGANEWLLQRAGLDPKKIYVDDTCTRCRRERFFSHRGDGGGTGRFAAVIGLRGEDV